MLNKITQRLIQGLMLAFITLGVAHAEETFETGGTITKVDKAAQVIFVGDSRMMIDDKVVISYENKHGHLLNIAEEGMKVNISGRIENNGVYTITSAYIYPKSK